jgi:hypothetical protein
MNELKNIMENSNVIPEGDYLKIITININEQRALEP